MIDPDGTKRPKFKYLKDWFLGRCEIEINGKRVKSIYYDYAGYKFYRSFVDGKVVLEGQRKWSAHLRKLAEVVK